MWESSSCSQPGKVIWCPHNCTGDPVSVGREQEESTEQGFHICMEKTLPEKLVTAFRCLRGHREVHVLSTCSWAKSCMASMLVSVVSWDQLSTWMMTLCGLHLLWKQGGRTEWPAALGCFGRGCCELSLSSANQFLQHKVPSLLQFLVNSQLYYHLLCGKGLLMHHVR